MFQAQNIWQIYIYSIISQYKHTDSFPFTLSTVSSVRINLYSYPLCRSLIAFIATTAEAERAIHCKARQQNQGVQYILERAA